MKSVFIIVSGRVQGVGFRYFALHKALELNITGWVKNTSNGTVEIEATGDAVNLQTYTEWIKLGPTRAIVKTFSATEITPNNTYSNFIIR